jgi:ATP-dependent DNA ligase
VTPLSVFEQLRGFLTSKMRMSHIYQSLMLARIRLVSRNGVEHTRRFADLAAAVAELSARTLVLDGEVAIYDEQLRSRFDWLRDPDPNAVATPQLFMQQVVAYGFEGYVAKDEGSRYEGGPTRAWLKVKQRGWRMGEDRWRRRMFQGA